MVKNKYNPMLLWSKKIWPYGSMVKNKYNPMIKNQ